MPTNSTMLPGSNKELNSTAPKSLIGPQAFKPPVVVSRAVDGAPGLICYSLLLSSIRLIAGEFDQETLAALPNIDIDFDIGTYAIVTPQYQADNGKSVQADVYVGSSSKCPSRLAQHHAADRLPGARRFYIIYSTDADLNAEHARQCEALVQQVATAQPEANLIGQSAKLRAMGEYDTDLMGVLAPCAVTLLAAAGFPMTYSPELLLQDIPFLSNNGGFFAALPETQVEKKCKTDPAYHWTFSDSGDLSTFRLSGRHDENGNFVVDLGSHFRTDGEYTLAPEIVNRREELLEGGYLSDAEGLIGRMTVRKPCTLSSARVAVRVMTKCIRKRDSWRVTYAPIATEQSVAA